MKNDAGKLFNEADAKLSADSVTTGILPDRDIAKLIDGGRISAEGGIDASQLQPASLDLRLGATAWRVRASFLPGKSSTVQAKIDRLQMHKIDLTKPVVLEKGCVYIAELQERLSLPKGLIARANPNKTGLYAFILSLPTFLIPIAFVRDPAILFVGEWVDIALAGVTLCCGSAAWIMMVSGYLGSPLNAAERVLFGLLAIVLILVPFGSPGRYASIALFALLAAWCLRASFLGASKSVAAGK